MDSKEFGKYLRQLRGEKSTRQIEILSGVSKSYISLLERGGRGIPKPEILQKLSKAYGASYEELMLKAGYINYTELAMKALEKMAGENNSNEYFEITPDPINLIDESLSSDDQIIIRKLTSELKQKTNTAEIIRRILKE